MTQYLLFNRTEQRFRVATNQHTGRKYLVYFKSRFEAEHRIRQLNEPELMVMETVDLNETARRIDERGAVKCAIGGL